MVASRYLRVGHVYSVGADIGFDPCGEIDGGYPFVDDCQRIEIDLRAAMRLELHFEPKRRLNHSGLWRRINHDDIGTALDAGAKQRVVGWQFRLVLGDEGGGLRRGRKQCTRECGNGEPQVGVASSQHGSPRNSPVGYPSLASIAEPAANQQTAY